MNSLQNEYPTDPCRVETARLVSSGRMSAFAVDEFEDATEFIALRAATDLVTQIRAMHRLRPLP